MFKHGVSKVVVSLILLEMNYSAEPQKLNSQQLFMYKCSVFNSSIQVIFSQILKISDNNMITEFVVGLFLLIF